MRFRAPANIMLRRAQIVLMLAALIPTILMTGLGIFLLAVGSGSVAVITGLLVVAFCTSSLTGYILGSIFVSRGASLARVQNDFLSTVSHELRTPLTSILLFIETLRNDRVTDPEEKRQCLDLLNSEVQRLERLVDRLLRLSQIEAGRHAFERLPVHVGDVIDDALTSFEVATIHDRVAVEVDANRNLCVTGDRTALAQAISNLLVNSFKYTDRDGRRIGLRAQAAGPKWIEIVVSDNGPGIPWREQRHIFDKFERGRAAIDGRTHGSGLGLAIVRAIARAHRGRVEVRSRAKHGSEFRIALPRREDAQ